MIVFNIRIMIARFESLLDGARGERRAVAALAVYDLEGAVAVLRAAGVGRRVVLLLPARVLREGADGIAVAALRAAAAYAPGRVCLQADHVHDLETVELACRLGAGAVMADGSHLPFEDNVAFTRDAVAIARQHGVAVEGEVGQLPGDVDADAPVAAGAPTDAGEAGEFAARTGVDCLAVAVGAVHGTLLPAPGALDWARLDSIRAGVGVPLALHGGSGLPPELVARGVRAGRTQVNGKPDVPRADQRAPGAGRAGAAATADVAGLHLWQAAAVAAVAERGFAVLDRATPAVAA